MDVKSKGETKRKIFAIIATIGCLLGAVVSFVTPLLVYLINVIVGLFTAATIFTGPALIESIVAGFNVTTLMFVVSAILCAIRVFVKKMPLFPLAIVFGIMAIIASIAVIVQSVKVGSSFLERPHWAILVLMILVGLIGLAKAIVYFVLMGFVFLSKKAGKFLWVIPVVVFVLFGAFWAIGEVVNPILLYAVVYNIPEVLVHYMIVIAFEILLVSPYILAVALLCLGVGQSASSEKKAAKSKEELIAEEVEKFLTEEAEEATEVIAETIASEEAEEIVETVGNEETELAETAQE